MNNWRAEEFIRDIAKNGLRCDVCPTHDMSSLEAAETFWHRYLRDVQKSLQDRALSILGDDEPTRYTITPKGREMLKAGE